MNDSCGWLTLVVLAQISAGEYDFTGDDLRHIAKCRFCKRAIWTVQHPQSLEHVFTEPPVKLSFDQKFVRFLKELAGIK